MTILERTCGLLKLSSLWKDTLGVCSRSHTSAFSSQCISSSKREPKNIQLLCRLSCVRTKRVTHVEKSLNLLDLCRNFRPHIWLKHGLCEWDYLLCPSDRDRRCRRHQPSSNSLLSRDPWRFLLPPGEAYFSGNILDIKMKYLII